MSFSSQTAPIQVVAAGSVAGVAWSTAWDGGASLHVIGKLTLHAEGQGYVSLVAPEPPGWHLGQPAAEESESRAPETLVVRGARQHPGRVVLRRGEATAAEVAFEPGLDLVAGPMAPQAMSGVDDGEWFVASGGDSPSARRWCKLPRFGVVATWGSERLVLRYGLFLVCVSSWNLSLLYRGTRRTQGPPPHSIELHVLPIEDLVAMGAAEGDPSFAEMASSTPFKAAPRVARIATSAEDAPAPADLAMFSNEATMLADEEADDSDVDTRVKS